MYTPLFLLAILLNCSLAVAEGDTKTEITNEIKHTVNHDTIKIGNHKIKNYNIHETSYKPTTVTQVVLNVPKMHKTLRKTRPPTEEEYAIKQKIFDVYEQARQELEGFSPHMEQLGRIIDALNPKYIATERVLRAALGSLMGQLDDIGKDESRNWNNDVFVPHLHRQDSATVMSKGPNIDNISQYQPPYMNVPPPTMAEQSNSMMMNQQPPSVYTKPEKHSKFGLLNRILLPKRGNSKHNNMQYYEPQTGQVLGKFPYVAY